MKIIFLDIDGVLNSKVTRAKAPSGFVGIETVFLKRIEILVKETGADIVLVSDWKIAWKHRQKDGIYLEEKFKEYDLVISDCTQEKSYRQRAEGILDYLNKHKAESYVILDDMKFEYEEKGLGSNFVKINPRYGLSNLDVDYAKNILGIKKGF